MVDMCMDFQCLAGSCVLVAPTIDRDIDGRSPAPCGDDCDDSDPNTFPGAPEICDGLDNDCDGTVDDGAPPLETTIQLAIGESTSGLVTWGDGFLITILTRVAMLAVPVTVSGRTGATFEVMRLTMGTRFIAQRAVVGADGRVLFAALTDAGTLRYTVLERGADGSPIAIEPATARETDGSVAFFDVVAFEDDWAIAVEIPSPTVMGELERDVYVAHDAMDPAIRLGFPPNDLSVGELALATDGTHLVLDDRADNVHFFLPDGTDVGSYPVMGISTRFRRGLASSEAGVIVGAEDMFDVRIAYLDSAGMLTLSAPAPAGNPGDTIDLVGLSSGVVVSRIFGSEAFAQIVETDLMRYGASFRLASAVGDPVERVTGAESGTATAVLGAALSGTTLGISGACGG
jgi:hypothetical protein